MTTHITIAGLGPGAFELLSLQTLDTLRQAPAVLLRTGRHPTVVGLEHAGIRFTTCDDLYETHATFEAVYRAVVARVLALAEQQGTVVYAVPGDPLVAERTVQMLLAATREREELTVTVLPALGALNLLFARLCLDPGDGLVVADARAPHLRFAVEAPTPDDPQAYHGAEPPVHPTVPTVWFQVDTAMVASELKLLLLEYYPPEHPVTVLTAVGAAEEQVTTLPLEELDRGTPITHLTSLYVPALAWPQRRHTITDMRAIMALLRGERGCPWDREQDMQTLRRTVIEEAYEVVGAIDRDDPPAVADELGDLLLNIVFLAQLGAEESLFTFDDVTQLIVEKLIRRHAHVFGDAEAATAGAVLHNWEIIKAGERAKKGEANLFSDVPEALPALARAQKIQKRAARVGFDWLDFRGPLSKIHEELEEISVELGVPETWERPPLLRDVLAPSPEARQLAAAAPPARMLHEIGDILFAAVNLCRFVHLDAEEALREANARFMHRFILMETAILATGRRLEDLPLEEMDRYWEESKKGEG